MKLFIYHRCICTEKKNSVHGVWYDLRFQVSIGGLGLYPLRVGGALFIHPIVIYL